VFFTVFYVATLIYRLLTDELGLVENAVLVMSNSFVFYGFGYAILDSRESLQPYEGLFTASHAAFHSLVAQAVSRFKASAIDVVQVLAVLIVTFATVAIPVQFDGNRVTLIWAVEATALFWFGRTRPIPLFEYFSYPIMALATISLFQDWVTAYGERTIDPSEFNRVPFANGDFVTAAVFVAVFAFIYLINRDKRYEPAIDTNFARLLGYIVSFIGLLALYNMFRTEIGNYFHLRIVSDQLAMTLGPRDGSARSRYADLSSFNVLWQLNYTMLFLSVLNWINLRKIRSSALAAAGIVLSIKCLAIFVTVGMALFHELNVVHLERGDSFATESSYVLIRYFSYAFTALLIYFLYEYSRDEMLTRLMSEEKLQLAFEAILYLTIFITASCELVNIMAQLRIPDSLKLGLSILWSVYALALISIGIAMNKKHLRISAFALLGVTIAKLFLYDIADLPTIPKTILFVSIGILMLISSFLYNKYMGRILSGAVEAGK
jgi:hypothetical protein